MSGVGVRADSMAPEGAMRMASVVQPGRQTGTGDELPLLWHWAYFPELGPTEALGRDGHLGRGDAWADRFPRRVAAGGRVTRQAPFVIGVPAERRSQLVGARERVGHSGPLVLCDWRHTYHQADETVLEEIQTLVFRPHRPSGVEGGDAPAPATSEGDERPWDRARQLEFGPVGLFRFSAVTWNSHRIHYDRPYATFEEGYGGLLVPGPLLAIYLAQEAERVLGELEAIEFRFKALVLDTDEVDVFVQRRGPRTCRAEARRADGTVAASLSATGNGT